jgi:hypothetical protein
MSEQARPKDPRKEYMDTTQSLLFGLHMRSVSPPPPESNTQALRARTDNWLELDKELGNEHHLSENDRRQLLEQLSTFFHAHAGVEHQETAEAVDERLAELPPKDMPGNLGS